RIRGLAPEPARVDPREARSQDQQLPGRQALGAGVPDAPRAHRILPDRDRRRILLRRREGLARRSSRARDGAPEPLPEDRRAYLAGILDGGGRASGAVAAAMISSPGLCYNRSRG